MVAWNAPRGRFALVTDAAPAAGWATASSCSAGGAIEAEDGVVRRPEGSWRAAR